MTGSICTRWTPVIERFHAQVDKGESCWLWRGHRNAGGYAQIRVNGRKEYVHRFAYRTFVGPIEEGLVIDHLCGEPSCVNPEHLEAVPQATNVHRGKLARLDAATAAQIREATGTHSVIGARFGVSPSLVSMIKSGRRWAVLS